MWQQDCLFALSKNEFVQAGQCVSLTTFYSIGHYSIGVSSSDLPGTDSRFCCLAGSSGAEQIKVFLQS